LARHYVHSKAQNKDTHRAGTFRVKGRVVAQKQSGKRKIEQKPQKALESWKEKKVLAFDITKQKSFMNKAQCYTQEQRRE
jgi:hypothetical protein